MAPSSSHSGPAKPDSNLGADLLDSEIGRYVVVGRLGVGGMGVVYDAYDPELGRRVAIKVLKISESEASTTTEDLEGTRAMLYREAQAMAKVSHPNIIPVFDVGTTPNGRLFVAMERIEGQTLSRWARTIQRETFAPPRWQQVLRVMKPAAQGMAAAHRAGLVHRDFKPENVMLGKDGRILILDFGLARRHEQPKLMLSTLRLGRVEQIEASQSTGSQSTTGIAGTAYYMAPEQHRGEPADARSDVFSFCVSMFELLYGVRPYTGQRRVDVEQAIATGALAQPSAKISVPRWLHRMVMQGLAANPDERPASMQAMLDIIEARSRARKQRRTWLRSAAAGTVAAWVITLLPEQSQPCSGGDEPFASVWNARRSHSIVQAFTAAGNHHATDTLERVIPRLAEFASDWAAGWQDACEDHKVNETDDDAAFDLRMACLDTAKSQAQALVELMSTADSAVVDNAVRALSTLPELDDCSDLERLRSREPWPSDPTLRRKVARLRDRKAAALSIGAAGRTRECKAEVEELALAARKLGYEVLDAEFHESLGRLNSQLSQVRAAIEHNRRAMLLGIASGHHRVAASVTIAQVQELGYRSANVAAAEQLLDIARARVRAVDDEPELLAHFLGVHAITHGLRGRHHQALTLLERQHDILAELRGPESIEAATVLDNVSITHQFLGDVERAIEINRRSLAIKEQLLGPKHPSLSLGLSNLGTAHAHLGEYATMRALNTRSLNLCTSADQDLGCALYYNNTAVSHQLSGARQSALALFIELAQLQDRHGSRGHPAIGWAHTNIGMLLMHMGLPEDGYVWALQGVEREREERAPAVHRVSASLQTAARTAFASGRAADAERHLALSSEIVPETSVLAAQAELFHARAMADIHVQRARRLGLREPAAQRMLDEALSGYWAARNAAAQSRGPTSMAVAENQLLVAQVLEQLGYLHEAEAMLAWTCPTLDRSRGFIHPMAWRCWHRRGVVEMRIEGGDRETARAWLKTAHALFDPVQADPSRRSGLEFDLARVSWACAHGDRVLQQYARDWAESALTGAQSGQYADPRDIERMRRWLASHELHHRAP